MAEFKSYRLADVVLQPPLTGVRQREDGDGDEIPWVPRRYVIQGRPVMSSVPYEITRGDPRGRFTANGDLLLVTRGADRKNGARCKTVRFDQPSAYSESLALLKPDTSIVEADYLRLYLTSRLGATALAAATTGGVIGNLRPDALMEIEVRIPILDIQQGVLRRLFPLEDTVAQLRKTERTARHLHGALREGLVSGLIDPRDVL